MTTAPIPNRGALHAKAIVPAAVGPARIDAAAIHPLRPASAARIGGRWPRGGSRTPPPTRRRARGATATGRSPRPASPPSRGGCARAGRSGRRTTRSKRAPACARGSPGSGPASGSQRYPLSVRGGEMRWVVSRTLGCASGAAVKAPFPPTRMAGRMGRRGVNDEGPAASRRRGLSYDASEKRDSNSRPSAWEADALPTELFSRAGRRRMYGGRADYPTPGAGERENGNSSRRAHGP